MVNFWWKKVCGFYGFIILNCKSFPLKFILPNSYYIHIWVPRELVDWQWKFNCEYNKPLWCKFCPSKLTAVFTWQLDTIYVANRLFSMEFIWIFRKALLLQKYKSSKVNVRLTNHDCLLMCESCINLLLTVRYSVNA